MNKIILSLALVAVACSVASAELKNSIFEEAPTQFSFGIGWPNADDETANLKPEHMLFKDFCLNAGDKIRAHATQIANEKVSTAFDFISSLISDSASSISSIGSTAVTEGQTKINEDAMKFAQVLKGIAQIIFDSAKDEGKEVYRRARQGLSTETLIEEVRNECLKISRELKPSIEKMFTTDKKEIYRTPGLKREDRQKIDEVKMKNLGCTTVQRMMKISIGCDLLTAVVPMMQNYF